MLPEPSSLPQLIRNWITRACAAVPCCRRLARNMSGCHNQFTLKKREVLAPRWWKGFCLDDEIISKQRISASPAWGIIKLKGRRKMTSVFVEAPHSHQLNAEKASSILFACRKFILAGRFSLINFLQALSFFSQWMEYRLGHKAGRVIIHEPRGRRVETIMKKGN